MHRELLDALSTGWIESALDVSRTAVADWRRGKFPERRRIQLAEAVLTLLPDTKESPQPEWARAMESRLRDELVTNRELIEALARPELLRAAERVIARLEALGPLGGEALSETDGAEGQDVAGPPIQGRGSRHEPVPE